MLRTHIRRLIGFGLTIESDRDVPGALADQGLASPDLRIVTLSPAPFDVPQPPIYHWQDGTLTFSPAGVGSYACQKNGITITPAPNADPDLVTALMIATALPAIGWLRGDVMLHAAGIVAPSRPSALLLAGPSGVGKSTLTAQLMEQGGTLLADDSIRLRFNDGIEASGLPGGYHLCRSNDHGRDFHGLPAERCLHTAPIRAVAVLARTDGPARLVRLRPTDGFAKLMANLHRPAIPAILGRHAHPLAMMAAMANQCAIYEWHRSTAAMSGAERAMLADEGL